MSEHQGLQNSHGPEVAVGSGNQQLKDGFGPEVVPYQNSRDQQAPEHYGWEGHKSGGQQADYEVPREVSATAKPKRRILRLSLKAFWAIVVLIVVILGVGIGVGLGVGLRGSSSTPESSSADNSSPPAETTSDATSSTTSTTSTTTSSAPVTSGTVGVAANSCNFKTPKSYHASDGTVFLQHCFTDWPVGEETADGKGNVTDLSAVSAYTFEGCMEACLKYNEDNADDTQCQGITYNANLTSSIVVGKHDGNCFLKDKPGVDLPGPAEAACAAITF